MKIRMAPRAAWGKFASSPVARAMTATTTAAATRLATCDFPPDAATTALRGGLAFTGNEPVSPAATLAAPMPTRSWSRASAASAPLLRERQVAALWTRHRNATVKAGAASLVTCEKGADGRPIDGRPPETGPSTRTPWSLRCRIDAAAMAAASPMSAPGMRRSMRSPIPISTSTVAASPMVHGLAWGSWRAISRSRSIVDTPPPGRPRTEGSCRTKISTAIPARIPVTTGVEMKSAIHPSLSRPASSRMTPTATAMHATRCWYCGVPAAATATTPVATTGAIVESAPTDICRLAPKTAIISDPTTKA